MIVLSSSTAVLCPQQQWTAAMAAWPVPCSRFNSSTVITCSNRDNHFRVRLVLGGSRRRVYATAKGPWEDPDDGSDDDSEYEEEEEDEETDEDEDYKSDWETNVNDTKVVVTNASALSVKEYEETLVRGLHRGVLHYFHRLFD